MGSHGAFFRSVAYACLGLGGVFFNGRPFGGMGNAEFPPYYFDELVPDNAFAKATREAAEQGAPELDEHFLHGKWG